MNGDGITDLGIGVSHDDDGGTNKGSMFALFMDANKMVQSKQKISETQGNLNETLATEGFFGFEIKDIGDWDGDGVDDIAISNPTDDDDDATRGGVFWMVFLNANGTVKSKQKISPTSGAGFVDATANTDDRFGVAITRIGDLDGDGVNRSGRE